MTCLINVGLQRIVPMKKLKKGHGVRNLTFPATRLHTAFIDFLERLNEKNAAVLCSERAENLVHDDDRPSHGFCKIAVLQSRKIPRNAQSEKAL